MRTVSRGGARSCRRRRDLVLLACAALVAALATAPAAQATFHEMSIREVYPGGSDNASYVELQMWAPGQEFVGGHHLVAYNANGSVNKDFSFASSVSNGANQATILVADTSYATVFPSGPTPDASEASLNLSPTGGAVCWTEGSPPDCVAWGNFTGPLPAHVPTLLVGSPASAGGVAAGKALQRTIASNCATLLEPADDSDNSATDFSEQTPSPRNNTSAIPEHDCLPPPDETPPITTIDLHPPNPSGSADASFSYHADEPGSSFECKLDGAAFKACPTAGIAYTGLANGSHSFQVRATDPSKNVDPTPAGYSFDVVIATASSTPPPPAASPTTSAAEPAPPPATKITVAPSARTRDRTPTVRFHSDIAGARFECSVDAQRFLACRSPLTTKRLGFGLHSIRVRAIVDGAVDPTPATARFKVVRGGGKAKPRRHHRTKQAQASTFHLVQVREVYPGSASNPQAEYVELQMYASGQEFVGGHVVRTYDAAGSLVKANVLGADVANGANQRTVLVATPEAEAQFGVQADATLAPSGQLDPSGGAVCWETLDCVAWGSFSGSTPSPSGAPADPSGVPDGMALRRTIAPSCPTLLEAADDSGNSAADFSDAFPAPQPNSATPSEHACSNQLPGGGGNDQQGDQASGANRRRPQTRFRRSPPHRTRDRTPTFRFASTVSGSTYLCKLDRGPFGRCRSPFTTPHLQLGQHVLKVKARAPNGGVDTSPAAYGFRIVRRLSGR